MSNPSILSIMKGITNPYQNPPTETGQRAVCPDCGSTLIAKCGELKIDHWAHETSNDCDSWHEPMTQWHLDWQAKFPEEWREVTIRKPSFEEYHRADVLTSEGIIIEFQHSSISSEDVKRREEFYDNMIWVIDGARYKSIYYNEENTSVSHQVNVAERLYIRIIGTQRPLLPWNPESLKQIIRSLYHLNKILSSSTHFISVDVEFPARSWTTANPCWIVMFDYYKNGSQYMNDRWSEIVGFIMDLFSLHNAIPTIDFLRKEPVMRSITVEYFITIQLNLKAIERTIISQLTKPTFIDCIPDRPNKLWSMDLGTLISKESFVRKYLGKT